MEKLNFKLTTRKLTIMALFVALEIIVGEFMDIPITPKSTVSLTFVIIFLCSMLVGPLESAMTAAVADILGTVLFGGGGIFFGFTLTAFLVALTYGLFFYKQNVSIIKLIISNSIVFLFCYNTLNTLWISIMYDTPFIPNFISRLPKNLILLLIAIILLKVLSIAVIKNAKYLRID